MMKRMMLAVVFTLFTLSACGSSDKPEASPSTPTATQETTPSATPTVFEPPKLESLIVAPGGVGPLDVGMTVEQALATQVAQRRKTSEDDGCDLPELQWHTSYQDALDVWIGEDGKIVSIGVFEPGPHTIDGIGVGSTMADISRVYENAEMESAGFDQTGVFVTDGSQWLGFLFNEKLEDMKRTAVVKFLEVTGENKPSLMRTGC